MLTRKQHELLMYIHERIKETGVSPSFDEMKEALDLASKSGIHRLITALEERGFLRRLPHRAVMAPRRRRRDGAAGRAPKMTAPAEVAGAPDPVPNRRRGRQAFVLRDRVRSLLFALAPLAIACAAHAPPPSAPPSYAPVATRPASPHAALYAACLADAVASQRVAQAEDPGTSLIVFTCHGAPAQAFFDGLADWSAREHSQFVHAGRTYRRVILT